MKLKRKVRLKISIVRKSNCRVIRIFSDSKKLTYSFRFARNYSTLPVTLPNKTRMFFSRFLVIVALMDRLVKNGLIS